MMQAVVCDRYGAPGDVLHPAQVSKPVPKPNEVLIQIKAASVNAADWHLIRADPGAIRLIFGLFHPPRIMGGDVAGVIEAVGGQITKFEVGDEVFADISPIGFGGYAQYVCCPEKHLARKPANMSFEQTAAVPMAAVTALQALRDNGKITAGMKVLVNGASGGVGHFAVQIAKSFDTEVTAVCSARNADMVKTLLKADRVWDYTDKDDFMLKPEEQARYDLIVDCASKRSVFEWKRLLAPKGRFVFVGGTNGRTYHTALMGPFIGLFSTKKISLLMADPNGKDLAVVADLCETGKVTPIIDRRFPLAQTAEAVKYVDEGHTQGKVVINIA